MSQQHNLAAYVPAYLAIDAADTQRQKARKLASPNSDLPKTAVIEWPETVASMTKILGALTRMEGGQQTDPFDGVPENFSAQLSLIANACERLANSGARIINPERGNKKGAGSITELLKHLSESIVNMSSRPPQAGDGFTLAESVEAGRLLGNA